MKKAYLFIVLCCAAITSVTAQQRLVFNEKAPQLQISEYLFGGPLSPGKSMYVEFFVPGTQMNEQYLTALETFASKYGDEINFVVMTKGDKNAVKAFFQNRTISYRVVYDDQDKTFTAFGVKYLPMSVIIDKKGRFVWQGKASQLDDATLARYR